MAVRIGSTKAPTKDAPKKAEKPAKSAPKKGKKKSAKEKK